MGRRQAEDPSPPLMPLDPEMSPRVLLRQRKSNNSESQIRPKPKPWKNKNKNPASTLLQLGTNRHFHLGGRWLGAPSLHCGRSRLTLVSLPSSSHSPVSLLMAGPSFQAHPGRKGLFTLVVIECPRSLFPESCLLQSRQTGRVSLGLVIKVCSNLVKMKFHLLACHIRKFWCVSFMFLPISIPNPGPDPQVQCVLFFYFLVLEPDWTPKLPQKPFDYILLKLSRSGEILTELNVSLISCPAAFFTADE